jgi:hypothetical protein
VQGGVDSTAVPKPATLAMVGGAFLALGLLRRRRAACAQSSCDLDQILKRGSRRPYPVSGSDAARDIGS